MKNRKGFTLLEILLVVAALAILAGIVILAINPTKQLGETRDAQRHSDVNAILNAVYQYSIDNNGDMPASIPVSTALAPLACGADTTEICASTGVPACITTPDPDLVDLGVLYTTGKYLTALPRDPQTYSAGAIGYYIVQDETNGDRITVCAPNQEQAGGTISVTR